MPSGTNYQLRAILPDPKTQDSADNTSPDFATGERTRTAGDKVPEIYLSLMTGRSPEETRPILITRDPALLRAFVDAVRQRVENGLAGDEARRVLELLDEEGDDD